MTTTAISTQRTTITTPEINPNPSALSIRQICMQGILGGKTTKVIASEIIAAYPNSAAAAKSGKHIAWYRATMKKAGQLPPKE